MSGKFEGLIDAELKIFEGIFLIFSINEFMTIEKMPLSRCPLGEIAAILRFLSSLGIHVMGTMEQHLPSTQCRIYVEGSAVLKKYFLS